jgi:hypothetical protein
MLMECSCSLCNTDLFSVVFHNTGLKNKVMSPINLKRSPVMLHIPECFISREARALNRYQSRLVRHRKWRDAALDRKVV